MKEEKIKTLYLKFTNRQIESLDFPIIKEAFSSVLLDRFVAELEKLEIYWDKTPTSINMLTSDIPTEYPKRKVVNSLENQNLINKSSEGIGIDFQKISAFSQVEDFWEDAFYEEHFTRREIGYALKKENPLETLAGIYAAKEAIFKATGISREQIDITFSESGKPLFNNILLSISHDGDIAIAVAYFYHPLVNDSISPKIEPIGISTFETPISKPIHLTPQIHFLIICSIILIFLYIIYKEVLV